MGGRTSLGVKMRERVCFSIFILYSYLCYGLVGNACGQICCKSKKISPLVSISKYLSVSSFFLCVLDLYSKNTIYTYNRLHCFKNKHPNGKQSTNSTHIHNSHAGHCVCRSDAITIRRLGLAQPKGKSERQPRHWRPMKAQLVHCCQFDLRPEIDD